MAVRMLLSHNLPVSVTRLVADTARVWTARGVQVTVLFPVVDWVDFKWFQIQRLSWGRKIRWAAHLAVELVVNGLRRRRWCGFQYYHAPSSVRAERYWLSPRVAEALREEITMVHHTYVVPHLLRGYARHGMKMVGVIHNNYESEMGLAASDQAAWKTYCLELERRLAMPRIATSEDLKAAAERLGIPVHPRVVRDGVDVRLFRPAAARAERGRLTVTLYCSLHPQKGQAVGLQALAAAQAAWPRSGVRWCSVGHVLPGSEGVFDHHFGYVHGDAYVRALQESDIMIYPSLFDGFPAPPLQAMACGAALVTTLVEGVKDWAEDGANCVVCPPGDAPALHAQIVRVLGDGALRERLRAHGRQTAEAMSMERSAEALLGCLEEIFEGPVPSRFPSVAAGRAASSGTSSPPRPLAGPPARLEVAA